MDEASLIAQFERAVASRPPTPHLVAESIRIGRRIRRRRRLAAAATSALVVGLIAAIVPAAHGARSRPRPAARGHAAVPETVYSASSNGLVTPIRVAGNVTRPGIQIARMVGQGAPLAVAPDGKVIYAASAFGEITPINLSTNTAGRAIRVATHILTTILITPDGRTAYVMEAGGEVIPVDLARGRPGKLIRTGADQMVITSDGKTVYAFNDYSRSVLPIRTATGTALKSITVGQRGDGTINIAVSPDKATVYALTGNPSNFGGQITPISTATNTAEQPINLTGSVMDIAISPSGQTAYVTEYTRQNRYALLPVDLATRKVLRPISLPAQLYSVSSVAFSPDGSMAYVVIGSNPDTHRAAEVVPVRTATNTGLAPVHLPISHPSCIAVSPDGSTVYVSGELLSNWLKYAVFPIRAGAKSAGRPIAVPEAPVALVFAP
jgi:DNA-binding beta-propeller fold protein YncE